MSKSIIRKMVRKQLASIIKPLLICIGFAQIKAFYYIPIQMKKSYPLKKKLSQK